ncbi:hypothetical protein [Paenibacillus hamazuiensis]|uniref:phosphatase domain-containing putative toxin n=1 Tax=Paenibacillus hamazuiensis TaxID=2936508 RepID=UPI00200CA292|nr:hypothetical protein [Paenibacillus hamazuiensis]
MNSLEKDAAGLPSIKRIVEAFNDGSLPAKFRTTSMEVKAESGELPDLSGFRQLKISGSGQFSQSGLKTMAQAIAHPAIIIVDLRQESHGFVNGAAVNWFAPHNAVNKGYGNDEVLRREKEALEKLRQEDPFVFDHVEGKSAGVHEPIAGMKTVLSEEEAVRREGLMYVRFFVTDHHHPSAAETDRFIRFVKTLTDDVWLHFHCRGGVGRTTTFMLMYDMLRNVPDVNFEDFLRRQRLIGGRDMFRMDPKEPYKYAAAIDRLEFIRTFHEYCVQNCGNGYEVPWSQWFGSRQQRRQ